MSETNKEEEKLALLELLALGRKELTEGQFSDAEKFLEDMDD